MEVLCIVVQSKETEKKSDRNLFIADCEHVPHLLHHIGELWSLLRLLFPALPHHVITARNRNVVGFHVKNLIHVRIKHCQDNCKCFLKDALCTLHDISM